MEPIKGPGDRRYTVKQAAAVADVSPSWIYEKVASGELEQDALAYQGERMRIRRSALEKLGKEIDESRLQKVTPEEYAELQRELEKVRELLQEQYARNESLHTRLVLAEDTAQSLLEELAKLRGDAAPQTPAEVRKLRRAYEELVGHERAEPRGTSHEE